MALSKDTFSSAGGAVADIFAGFGAGTRAKGKMLEAQEYDLAAQYARQNEQYTKESTAIKTMQQDRQLYMAMGETRADIAGAGFQESGSALDLLRDSASQGALTKAVIGQQGLIEEAGYEEQAKSYDLMAQSARMAASAEKTSGIGSFISGGIKGIAAVATLL